MQVVEERFTFGNVAVAVVRPENVADMIDEARFATDEYMPYWAEIWPAGVELARHVAGLDASDLAGADVLELGCGLGLPALVAALRGARVTATDWSPEAIDALVENAARNGVAIDARIHDWRDPDALAGARFDLVLAADVLYEARNAEPLLRLLDRTVGPAGEAIVADPGRRHAAAFFDAASATWDIEAIREPSLPAGALHRLRRCLDD